MKILRLGTSDDREGRVPPEAMAYRLVEAALQERTGERVETIVKPIWPTERLPQLVDRWMTEYEPDVVFMKTASFWFDFESMPLKLERKFGRFARPFTSLGLRAADTSWFAHNRFMLGAKRGVQRVVGGDTHFTAEEVLQRLSETARLVLRHEGVILVVRGPRSYADYFVSNAHRARAERSRQVVHQGLKQLCAELHVRYDGSDTPLRLEKTFSLLGDELHRDVAGQRRAADEEIAIFEDVWRELREQPLPVTR